ncbi:60 kDa chaperonin [subsurface metagenome]
MYRKKIKREGENTLRNFNPKIYNDAVSSLGDKDVQVVNFDITRAIAKVIMSMFGPKGLNKMIIPFLNDPIITQKGDKVVKTFKSRIPITLMLLDLVKTQEKNCGDGTKTALLLTAFLLEKTRDMLALGIPPHIINKGFYIAMNKALEILEDNIIQFDFQNEHQLIAIIKSVMNHKFTYHYKESLIELIVETLKNNTDLFFKSQIFVYSDIMFRKVPGKSANDSELINGMIIYKDKPNLSLPNKITNAGILLIRKSLDFFIQGNKELFPKEVEINSKEMLQEFSNFRNTYYGNLARLLKQKGVDVILCQKKINPYFVDYCASIGIIALELVGEEDIKKLTKLLEINAISSLSDLSNIRLGNADSIEFKKISGDEMFFINIESSKILTFLIRGGIAPLMDELEEILNGSLRVAIQTVKDKKLLPGGGALECEISQKLKNYAQNYPNKYQIVIKEYAKAIENLPAHLIMNSAAEPLDLIPQLRAEHSNGQKHMGFNCTVNDIVDVVKEGIYDGYFTKKHIIKIASELARQIIRVDYLIMVYDRKLYEQIEKEGKEVKSQKHQEKVRKYLNKKDEDLFSDLYETK